MTKIVWTLLPVRIHTSSLSANLNSWVCVGEPRHVVVTSQHYLVTGPFCEDLLAWRCIATPAFTAGFTPVHLSGDTRQFMHGLNLVACMPPGDSTWQLSNNSGDYDQPAPSKTPVSSVRREISALDWVLRRILRPSGKWHFRCRGHGNSLLQLLNPLNPPCCSLSAYLVCVCTRACMHVCCSMVSVLLCCRRSEKILVVTEFTWNASGSFVEEFTLSVLTQWSYYC